MAKVQIPGEECGPKCILTKKCTHFTWTTLKGGTCRMKAGSVSKSDAFSTSDKSMVCGIVGKSFALILTF